MNITKRIIVLLLLSISCIGCDQTSKYYASEHLPKNGMTSHFGDTLRIGYTENRGAFLGIGKDLPEKTRFLVFTGLASVFLIGFLFYMLFSQTINLHSLVPLVLIFTGGASNVYDRIVNNGAVIDFLNVGVGNTLRTGIFNIADMAILLGGFLFVFTTYQTTENH